MITPFQRNRQTARIALSVLMALALVSLLFGSAQPVFAEPDPPFVAYDTIHIPANALNYRNGSVITKAGQGLQWAQSGVEAATVIIPRPANFMAGYDLTLSVYYKTTVNSGGKVNFFIRPREFDPGDTWFDVVGISGTPVSATAANQIQRQDIIIPAAKFTGKPLWWITLQRNGTGETYADDVIVMGVEIKYAMSLFLLSNTTNQGYPAKALNFGVGSSTYSQTWSGILFHQSWAGGPFLTIPQPQGWGFTDVTFEMYFMQATAGTGNTGFFIRPRSYSPGDTFGDSASLPSSSIAVDAVNKIYKQTYTIPAGSFGAKPLWTIGIQRIGNAPLDTFSGDITLLAVNVIYQYKCCSTVSLDYPANSLSFVDGAVISQTNTGLTWKADWRESAFFTMPYRNGLNGKDLGMNLYFRAKSGTVGTVQFFIRPRSYAMNDIYGDVPSMISPPVQVDGINQIGMQNILIPSSRIGTKDLLVVTIQRNDPPDATYPDDVELMAVQAYIPFSLYLPFTTK
ncbi:MAG: hypothetical protein PHQ40_17565 [Anaerolineaceae bacterium]|nr:hypothetical protein [Anaerolineaceae bacterium]